MLGETRNTIKSNVNDALTGVSSVNGRVTSGVAAKGIGLPNIVYLVQDAYWDSGDNMRESYASGYRDISITIEARALLRNGSESPIDDLCLEIEESIASATTLNANVSGLQIESTTFEMEEDDKPLCLATLEYYGHYVTPDDDGVLTYVVLSGVAFESGESVINCFCYSDREGCLTVRPRSASTNWTGTPVSCTWNPSTYHGVQVTGFSANHEHIIDYTFDATLDPDTTEWTPFTDGITGPNVFTDLKNSGDPDSPNDL